MSVLGIDTSNYTTSLSVVDDEVVYYDLRKLLLVEKGKRGLRQGEALFQHVVNLPEMMPNLNNLNIKAVCVSSKPRPMEDSYMPVFRAGKSIALTISKTLNVPLFETSHQEGHIEAGVYSSGLTNDEFNVIHMSGGTTEVLYCKQNNGGYFAKIIGGTLDINFGQLIDRAGVAMGFDFPCGIKVDEYALRGETKDTIPFKFNGLYFNLSGPETYCLREISKGHPKEEVSFKIMLLISDILKKVISEIKNIYGLPILLVGGVACSLFLRKELERKFEGLYFSGPKYSSDNALGVGRIGLKKGGL